MLPAEMQEKLELLKEGRSEANLGRYFEQFSANDFVSQLTLQYTVVFQQRVQGTKHEVSVAREAWLALPSSKRPSTDDFRSKLRLVDCYLLSSYGNKISEISWIPGIEIECGDEECNQFVLSVSEGFKLDKTVDGWLVKAITCTRTVLSEDLLRKRGWQCESLPLSWLRSMPAKS